jgi:hypothetical protein
VTSKSNDRDQLLSTADTFQFDLAHRFAAAETFLGIEDFQTRQPAFTVVVGGDTFSQMLRGNSRFPERDAQRVHFWIVTDFHG